MHNSVKNLPAPRIVWIDFLKVFATFLVILQHSISPVWTTFSPDTFTWKMTNFFFILSRSAVLLFFMCSGAGMLKSERSISQIFKKNIIQIVKIYVAWMIIYGIKDSISLIQEDLASFRTITNAFIKDIIFGQYHTWFLLTLIALYMITPFLYFIVHEKRNMQYFLILSVLFTIAIPAVKQIDFLSRLTDTINSFNMSFVTGYVLYYVIGYYLSQVPWKKYYTYAAVAVLIVSYGCAYFFSTLTSVSTGNAHQEIYGEFSPLGFLIAITVFCLFRSLETHMHSGKLISALVGYGFGIYLMHPLLLGTISSLNGLSALLGACLLYAICVVICMLISQNRLLCRLLLK